MRERISNEAQGKNETRGATGKIIWLGKLFFVETLVAIMRHLGHSHQIYQAYHLLYTMTRQLQEGNRQRTELNELSEKLIHS